MTRVVVICLAVIVVAMGTTPPVSAQADQLAGSVQLVSQSTFRTADQPFVATLRIRTSSPPSSLEVALSTYRRLRARSEFVAALDGTFPTRTPADLQRIALSALTTDSEGNVAVTIQPRATQEGVYPIRVELRDADAGVVIDGFTTFVVTVPATVEADPIDVALVLPIHAPPAVRPDSTIELDDDRVEALNELASAATAHPQVALSWLPTAETLEALAGSEAGPERDTATRIANAAKGRQVIGTTYVPTDMRDLVAAGLTSELNAQLQRGRDTITSTIGTTPDPTVRVIDERLDSDALSRLEAQGVTRLVAAESALDPIRPPNGVTLTARFAIPGSERAFSAAAADPGLASHFVRDVPPALAATHLLADLAVLWLDRPGRSDERRGAVVVAPRSWVPAAPFVDTVLRELGTVGIFEPVTVDDFFESVGTVATRGRVLNRTFQPPEPATGLNTDAIRSARRRLEGFASVVAADNAALDVLDRMLLVSQSLDVRAARRGSYTRSVIATIDDQFEAIAMPERRSITLTAREGELPITITNDLPYPLTVVLTLESDALDFPAGATRRLELSRENTTERFEVHARGSGSFPVRVRVRAPDGGLLLAESTFTVRSTAVSGVGVLLSVGAALFLVVWWASHLRSRRAERRLELSER
jgi:hypothetical protein